MTRLFLVLSWLATVLAMPAQHLPVTSLNISRSLFESLEELARIVDISYCVGSTGISKPFQCLSRCNEFDGFELVTVVATPTSSLRSQTDLSRLGTQARYSQTHVAMSRSRTSHSRSESSLLSVAHTQSQTPLPTSPPHLPNTCHFPQMKIRTKFAPRAGSTTTSNHFCHN